MKRNIPALVLALALALSLAACGGGKPADPNLLKVGKYELLYKGACIMKDYDGNDALVLTLDYTNNTDETDCYLLSIVESATQNGTELTLATIYTAEDSFDTICDGHVCGCHARRDSGDQERLCTY